MGDLKRSVECANPDCSGTWHLDCLDYQMKMLPITGLSDGDQARVQSVRRPSRDSGLDELCHARPASLSSSQSRDLERPGEQYAAHRKSQTAQHVPVAVPLVYRSLNQCEPRFSQTIHTTHPSRSSTTRAHRLRSFLSSIKQQLLLQQHLRPRLHGTAYHGIKQHSMKTALSMSMVTTMIPPISIVIGTAWK